MLFSKKKFTFQRKKTENLENNNNEDSEKLEDKINKSNKYFSDKNLLLNDLVLSKFNFQKEESSPKFYQNNGINTLYSDNVDKEIISNNKELQYLINQNEDENIDFINTLLKLKGISVNNLKNYNSLKDLGIKENLDEENNLLLKSKKKFNIRNNKSNQSNSSNQTTKINSFNNINQQNENNNENEEDEILSKNQENVSCTLSENHMKRKNDEFQKYKKMTTKSEQNLCKKGLITIFNKNNINVEIKSERRNLENKNKEEIKVDYKRKKYLKIPINQKKLYSDRNNNIYNNKTQNDEKLDNNRREFEDEKNKKSFKKISSIDNLKEKINHTINHMNNNNNINKKSIINKRIVKRKKSMNNKLKKDNVSKNKNISNILGNTDIFENKSCINIKFTANKNQKRIKAIHNENKIDSKIIKKFVNNNLKLSINQQRRNEFLKLNISYDKYYNKIPISKEIKNISLNFNKENINKRIEKSPNKNINIIPINNPKLIYNTNLNSYTKIAKHKISNSTSNKKKLKIFPKNINNILCEDICEINNEKIKNKNIKNNNNLMDLMDKTANFSNSKLVKQINKISQNKIENVNNDTIKTKNFIDQDINISEYNDKNKKIKKSIRTEIFLFDNKEEKKDKYLKLYFI